MPVVQRGMTTGTRFAGAPLSRTANLMGVSRTTVSRVMIAYKKLEKVFCAKQNSGRKSKVTNRDRRSLKKIIARKRKTTLPQITPKMSTHFQYTVSPKTTQRELCAVSLYVKADLSKPLVPQQNITKTRQWCQYHQNSSQYQWQQSICSDESFTLF
ncbi:transposable element Tc1 transposase [Nephila pilipes]|uniref:Transposable element Tc1 transposase n=1 Tax=Nephila pilipes TaxID=299642 RepID=A0A8X6QN79_NEPPI|nr:transposable element Tc1 transposase [Nephila pilipes]